MKSIFKKLQDVRDAGAVDNETHVVSLNITEVADIIDARNRLRTEATAIADALGERGLIDFADDVRMLARL